MYKQNIHKTNDDIYLTLTLAIGNMRYSGIFFSKKYTIPIILLYI